MSNSLKDKWNNLRPEVRQKASIGFIVVGFVLVVGIVFSATGNKPKNPVNLEETKRSISLDPKLLEKTMTVKSDEQAGKIKELENQIAEMKKNGGVVPANPANAPALPSFQTPQDPSQKGDGKVPNPMLATQMPQAPAGGKLPKGSKAATPPPLPPGLPPQMNVSAAGTLPPPPGANGSLGSAPVQAVQREVIGDIEIASNPSYKQVTASEKAAAVAAQEDKKKARDIYLPPSYVEATLLNGLYAPTSESARGNPVPVLLRVRDLAQLPNEVKANIKGCFVISEAVGNLSDERAHLRLRSLSCISKGGESVIDQPVKGFVVDSDGKLGITGTVVSRMGSVIARSLIAGFFSGFGDALKQSSQYTSTTSNILGLGGTTQLLTQDYGQMALAGLGQGVSKAADDISKFYMDLAKQTMPVIEIGAAKRVTLVFSDGVTLQIKEFKRNKTIRKSKGL